MKVLTDLVWLRWFVCAPEPRFFILYHKPTVKARVKARKEKENEEVR